MKAMEGKDSMGRHLKFTKVEVRHRERERERERERVNE